MGSTDPRFWGARLFRSLVDKPRTPKTGAALPGSGVIIRSRVWRLDASQDFVQEVLLGQRPFDRKTLIDNGFRNRLDAVFGRVIGELCSLDTVGADVVILHGELIRQAHGPRTVRSGGSDEHLEVEGLAQLGEFVSTVDLEA